MMKILNTEPLRMAIARLRGIHDKTPPMPVELKLQHKIHELEKKNSFLNRRVSALSIELIKARNAVG